MDFTIPGMVQDQQHCTGLLCFGLIFLQFQCEILLPMPILSISREYTQIFRVQLMAGCLISPLLCVGVSTISPTVKVDYGVL